MMLWKNKTKSLDLNGIFINEYSLNIEPLKFEILTMP